MCASVITRLVVDEVYTFMGLPSETNPIIWIVFLHGINIGLLVFGVGLVAFLMSLRRTDALANRKR